MPRLREIEYTMLAYMSDTGEHADHFSASYMNILLTDEGRRAKYNSWILKHF